MSNFCWGISPALVLCVGKCAVLPRSVENSLIAAVNQAQRRPHPARMYCGPHKPNRLLFREKNCKLAACSQGQSWFKWQGNHRPVHHHCHSGDHHDLCSVDAIFGKSVTESYLETHRCIDCKSQCEFQLASKSGNEWDKPTPATRSTTAHNSTCGV